MLDSAAVFESRAEQIGVEQDELQRIRNINANTFGKFAFAANYTPGQADEQPLMLLISRVCNADPPPADRVPVIRRLFYESYTMANADLRGKEIPRGS